MTLPTHTNAASTTLSFVPAAQADLDWLLALRLSTMDSHLRTVGVCLTSDQHLELVKEDFDDAHVIYMDDGQRPEQKVGLAKFSLTDHCFYLKQLQIHPDFQGQGLGAKVIAILESTPGLDKARLSVLKNNPALGLYQRLGYRVDSEDDYEFWLSKPLNQSLHPDV